MVVQKRFSMKKSNQTFVELVWQYYKKHKRNTLPWRKTKDPYLILVSEVMLQQTQVERVTAKYIAFTKQYPTIADLAEAPLGDVLSLWQGLGYNRRAKLLHTCAKEVMKGGGVFPRTYRELVALPGIGTYTAGAILAFAYNSAVPIIETNIRTVYLRHFFKTQTDVSDAEILALVRETLDHKRPRDWYYALMDYGAHLKKTYGSLNSQSKHYNRQSTFMGSDRQIRGAIIRLLVQHKKRMTRKQVHLQLSQFSDIRVDSQMTSLVREGLIVSSSRGYTLPT
jgi:A/G-specific adenine glycosylase